MDPKKPCVHPVFTTPCVVLITMFTSEIVPGDMLGSVNEKESAGMHVILAYAWSSRVCLLCAFRTGLTKNKIPRNWLIPTDS